MKELLLKGETLQKRVPNPDKREQIRLKHNELKSKYSTVKVDHGFCILRSNSLFYSFF